MKSILIAITVLALTPLALRGQETISHKLRGMAETWIEIHEGQEPQDSTISLDPVAGTGIKVYKEGKAPREVVVFAFGAVEFVEINTVKLSAVSLDFYERDGHRAVLNFAIFEDGKVSNTTLTMISRNGEITSLPLYGEELQEAWRFLQETFPELNLDFIN